MYIDYMLSMKYIYIVCILWESSTSTFICCKIVLQKSYIQYRASITITKAETENKITNNIHPRYPFIVLYHTSYFIVVTFSSFIMITTKSLRS